MMRSDSDFGNVKMNYQIVAPRMYEGRIESIVSRITGFADTIQLTHLKLQQVMSRMVPDGVYLDADGLAEIDLGNGTNYNPQEALNMFFQTGSVIGRSFTSEGDMNPGKVPIQQINNGVNGGKLQALIQTYNYYLQMIRDVTGLNEARDASTPSRDALVGVQKLAAANSNTATRHVLQGMLFLTAEVAECLSLRISDIIEYSPTKDAFIRALGAHNVATLEEMSNLHLHDFGIFIELMPDDEEKQILENNIQAALQQQSIDLDDAIDLRNVRNVRLANELLKVKRKAKLERDQQMQQENIQAQSQANQEAQQAAAQSEIQKQQAKTQAEAQLEQTKNQLKIQYLQQEVQLKKELMQFEFELNSKLEGTKQRGKDEMDGMKEDRKDMRVDRQAGHQMNLAAMKEQQKTEGEPLKKFESSGNDILSGDAGMERYGL
jgi:RNase P/RNase MRP subunit p29